MILCRPLWPPFWANFDLHVLRQPPLHQRPMLPGPPRRLFHVVSTNGWPPILAQRSMLPSGMRRPGVLAKPKLCRPRRTTFEVARIEHRLAQPDPVDDRRDLALHDTVPGSAKISIWPVLIATGGAYAESGSPDSGRMPATFWHWTSSPRRSRATWPSGSVRFVPDAAAPLPEEGIELAMVEKS